MVTTPAWFYNEFHPVGTDFEDRATVAAFDRNQLSSSVEAERELVARLGITAGDSVIDFGCGTGMFAIQAALVNARVIAVDVSQAMLDAAHHKALQANVLDRIQFYHGGFLSFNFDSDAYPDSSANSIHGSAIISTHIIPVDYVVTKSALHHLPDFWKMVALLKIASLLKEDGIFYLRDTVFSFPEAAYHTHITNWIERVAKPAGEGWTMQDFELHVRQEYTTFGWILEQMLFRAELAIQTQHYHSSEYGEYICQKKSKEKLAVFSRHA